MGEDFFVRRIQIFAGILTDIAYALRVQENLNASRPKKAHPDGVNTVIEQA